MNKQRLIKPGKINNGKNYGILTIVHQLHTLKSKPLLCSGTGIALQLVYVVCALAAH